MFISAHIFCMRLVVTVALVLENMKRRRASQTVCDSMLCSLIVLGSLAFSLTYYRNDLRQLLRMFFLTAVLIGALLALRHSLGRARRRLGKWLSRAKEESKETVVGKPRNYSRVSRVF